jgi:hypothetical protein
MPARLLFALAGALRLAEHASAAPTNQCPGSPFGNTPTLRLIVETVPGHRPVGYLLSCGAPYLSRADGAPMALYADRTAALPHSWPTCPHEVIDLYQLVPAGTITGLPLPVASGWYLPLHPSGHQQPLETMRAAADAGYSHLTIDTTSLALAVAKRRHRNSQPC